MKKLLFILPYLTIIGCVKDSSEINPDKIFATRVNNTDLDTAIIIADKTIEYNFEIETLPGIDVDDGKQIVIAVSDGFLKAPNALGSNSTLSTINFQINAGKAIFRYTPSATPEEKVIISYTIENLTQFQEFKTIPSEPNTLKLTAYPAYPKISEDIEITTTLFKDNTNKALCSENLRIDFQCFEFSANDSIEPVYVVNDFSYSKYDETQKIVIAKNKITTNKVPGKIKVIAYYEKLNHETVSDTIIVEFKP